MLKIDVCQKEIKLNTDIIRAMLNDPMAPLFVVLLQLNYHSQIRVHCLHYDIFGHIVTFFM